MRREVENQLIARNSTHSVWRWNLQEPRRTVDQMFPHGQSFSDHGQFKTNQRETK